MSLGSNLGDRTALIRAGVRALEQALDGLALSSLYETEPRYVKEQPRFLNACATGRTRLTPRQLLSHLQDAEGAAGRRRDAERYGPRTLDLDLLLYGDSVREEPDLVVPHPHLRERAFVLIPLWEVAGDWIVPASHGHPAETVASLARRVEKDGVERWVPEASR